MKVVLLSILLVVITPKAWSQFPQTFYVKSKGVYVNLKAHETKVKVPFKEKEDFFFSLKNDTTAVIQEMKNKRLVGTKQYKISTNYDSVFVKRYSVVNGKRKLNVEKVIFRTVE